MFNTSSQLVIGQYIPTGSVIHRLNPLLKLILTLGLMGLIFAFGSRLEYACIGAFWIGVFLLTRLSIRFLIRGLKPVFFLLLLTFLIHVFVTKGKIPIDLGICTIYREGLFTAAHFVSRLIFLVGFTSILTLSTSAIELTFGLERLTRPLNRFGFPSEEFAMMLTIALRFIPVLFNELNKIMKAQMCRGANFTRGPLLQRARTYLSILVPLFVNSFHRAIELAEAMEVRCYQTGQVRSSLREYPFRLRDGVAISVFFLLWTLLVYVP